MYPKCCLTLTFSFADVAILRHLTIVLKNGTGVHSLCSQFVVRYIVIFATSLNAILVSYPNNENAMHFFSEGLTVNDMFNNYKLKPQQNEIGFKHSSTSFNVSDFGQMT